MAITFIIIFLLMLLVLVYVRTRTQGKYEVKLSDMAVALVPVLLWLLFSGQIHEFGIGDLKVKMREAYQKPVAPQVATTNLVEGKEFLSVGVDCKYAHEDEIQDIKTFPSYLPFKFILIKEKCEDDERGVSSPKFVGMLSVDDYKRYFLSPDTKMSGQLFVEWVKAKNIENLEQYIPSFVSAKNAILSETPKLKTLQLMESLKIDTLPVINDQGNFIGVVDRSRLTASFLIDVGNVLNK